MKGNHIKAGVGVWLPKYSLDMLDFLIWEDPSALVEGGKGSPYIRNPLWLEGLWDKPKLRKSRPQGFLLWVNLFPERVLMPGQGNPPSEISILSPDTSVSCLVQWLCHFCAPFQIFKGCLQVYIQPYLRKSLVSLYFRKVTVRTGLSFTTLHCILSKREVTL